MVPCDLQGFWVALALSVSMGVLISFSISLCATVNSPVATAITGNFKDVVATLVGWALFGGFAATGKTVLGLLLSFAGAATFSISKLRAAGTPPVGAKAPSSPLAHGESSG
jgi:solute carrier family 35